MVLASSKACKSYAVIKGLRKFCPHERFGKALSSSKVREGFVIVEGLGGLVSICRRQRFGKVLLPAKV